MRTKYIGILISSKCIEFPKWFYSAASNCLEEWSLARSCIVWIDMKISKNPLCFWLRECARVSGSYLEIGKGVKQWRRNGPNQSLSASIVADQKKLCCRAVKQTIQGFQVLVQLNSQVASIQLARARMFSAARNVSFCTPTIQTWLSFRSFVVWRGGIGLIVLG